MEARYNTFFDILDFISILLPCPPARPQLLGLGVGLIVAMAAYCDCWRQRKMAPDRSLIKLSDLIIIRV